MKGAIYYYSGTGNTALACRHVSKVVQMPFDLVDVTMRDSVDLAGVDVVGFAAPTEFWGVPLAYENFIEELAPQKGTPAFVLNTFGAMSGRTLDVLGRAVTERGFTVFAGHSLQTPENYPPMIARGMGAANAPSPKSMAAFDSFIADLGKSLAAIESGERPKGRRMHIGAFNRMLPSRARTTAGNDMGNKHVDIDACTECGTCAQSCPYGAIQLNPTPVFDQTECYGCWRCYNLCPTHAISTDKFDGEPYYDGPNMALQDKLG